MMYRYTGAGRKPRTMFVLSKEEKAELERRAGERTGAVRDVERARIILGLAEDPSPSAVARRVGVDVNTVARWRRRFVAERLGGLEDRLRPGRPRRIPPVIAYDVIETATQKPCDFGVMFRDVWSIESLAEIIIARHSDVPEVQKLAPSTVWRILHRADLRPHHMELWLHSKDPAFKEKVTEITDLYTAPLPPNSIVLCIDEKTGMQALGRPFAVKMPARHQAGRKDYDYIRHGTRTLIAAFNPHTGEVFGQVRATRTGQDIVEFMEALAARFPGVTIHVVWDNLNIHHDGPRDRWTVFNKRHGNRFHFHHTPIHASWVNQVESWFAILQKRVLRHGVFDSVEALENRVAGFIAHWNDSGRRPFRWKFKGYPLEAKEHKAA